MAVRAFTVTFIGDRPPTLGALASMLESAAAVDRCGCEFRVEEIDACSDDAACEECGADVPGDAAGVAGAWHDPTCSAYTDTWS